MHNIVLAFQNNTAFALACTACFVLVLLVILNIVFVFCETKHKHNQQEFKKVIKASNLITILTGLVLITILIALKIAAFG